MRYAVLCCAVLWIAGSWLVLMRVCADVRVERVRIELECGFTIRPRTQVLNARVGFDTQREGLTHTVS